MGTTSRKSESQTTRSTLLVPVRDTSAFSGLIQSAAGEKGFKTQVGAARALHVARPMFAHWYNGRRITGISLITYETLREWVEQRGTDADRLLFSRAFPRPATHKVSLGYTKWIDQKLAALLGLIYGVCWGVDQEGTPTALSGEAAFAGMRSEYKELRDRLERDYPDLVAFQTTNRQRGITPSRIELSVARILEPLLDHALSAFVEPDVREIKPTKLEQFIKAGISREQILLSARTDDTPRFNAVAALRLLEHQPRRERAAQAYHTHKTRKQGTQGPVTKS